MNSATFRLSEQETILVNRAYTGGYMIDSPVGRPAWSYACSLFLFWLICIFLWDVFQWARFCNVEKGSFPTFHLRTSVWWRQLFTWSYTLTLHLLSLDIKFKQRKIMEVTVFGNLLLISIDFCDFISWFFSFDWEDISTTRDSGVIVNRGEWLWNRTKVLCCRFLFPFWALTVHKTL